MLSDISLANLRGSKYTKGPHKLPATVREKAPPYVPTHRHFHVLQSSFWPGRIEALLDKRDMLLVEHITENYIEKDNNRFICTWNIYTDRGGSHEGLHLENTEPHSLPNVPSDFSEFGVWPGLVKKSPRK